MIIDITGTILTPGNLGNDCLGNGEHVGIECCCKNCDYYMCCMDKNYPNECIDCTAIECPRRLEHAKT